MANINRVMSTGASSSTSSIYGSRNVLSGLATGMDTEAMIENSVSGYKTKITQLQQKQTKYTWQQDAYRSITDKLAALNTKYTSYTSDTNLMSSAFFTGNSVTNAQGVNANAISAVGKSSSDIAINSVTQLASAARYAVKTENLSSMANAKSLTADNDVNLNQEININNISGSLTLSYGGKSVDLDFSDTDEVNNADELTDLINQKLSEVSITSGNKIYKASELIQASNDNGTISFDTTNADKSGNSVWMSGVSGNFKNGDILSDIQTGYSAQTGGKSFTVSGALSQSSTIGDYINGKTMEVTLDGVTKSVELATKSDNGGFEFDIDQINQNLDKAFGANKVRFSLDNGKVSFNRGSAASGSSLNIKSSEIGEKIGIDSGLSNYINTDKKLGVLLGDTNMGTVTENNDGTFSVSNNNNYDLALGGKLDTTRAAFDNDKNIRYDTDGNLIRQMQMDGETEAKWYRVDEDGDALFDFKINDKSVGAFNAKSSLASVMSAINNSAESDVNVSYSRLTDQFVFNTRATGADQDIQFDGGLAQELFGSAIATRTAGQDSIINATVNGENLTLSRSTNTIDMDGMTVTVRETFNDVLTDSAGNMVKLFADENNNFDYYQVNEQGLRLTDLSSSKGIFVDGNGNLVNSSGNFVNENGSETDTNGNRIVQGVKYVTGQPPTFKANPVKAEGAVRTPDAVTFKNTGESDKVVDTIKNFIDSFNEISKEIHDAYTTQPAEKSSSTHARYEPLTDDDKSGMSETAIKNYEDKAKQGLLFGDSDLSALYQKLINAVSPTGSDRIDLESIGITTAYSGGVTTLKLNEDQLRSALDTDPDKVRTVFTKTSETSQSDGLMNRVKSVLDAYASTSIVDPGILVKKAGTTLSSTSLLNNTVQKQADSVQTEIERWQTKMSSKIDYYTRQFTMLEKLTSQMNNQTGMMAGLMGGY